MKIYHVSQGQTHDIESRGGYLWSPQRNRNGSKNIGYETMKEVKRDDVIFYGANQELYAISIAITDYYKANQPRFNELAAGEGTWNKEGYRIDSNYTLLKNPLDMRPHYEWLAKNHVVKTAFDRREHRSQSYLRVLPLKQAEYILIELMRLAQNTQSLHLINNLLVTITDKID